MPGAEAGHAGETPADARSNRRRRVATTLLGLGILCAGAGWYSNHRAEQVSSAQANARITEQRTRQDGDLRYVDLSYEYRVGGVPFERRETRIVRKSVHNEAEAQAPIEQLGVGDEVTVYYDPKRPGQAALARAHGPHWLLFGVGALWLALGALWMAYDRGRPR